MLVRYPQCQSCVVVNWGAPRAAVLPRPRGRGRTTTPTRWRRSSTFRRATACPDRIYRCSATTSNHAGQQRGDRQGTAASVVSWSAKKIVVTVPNVATGCGRSPSRRRRGRLRDVSVQREQRAHPPSQRRIGVAAARARSSPWNTFKPPHRSASQRSNHRARGHLHARARAGSVDSSGTRREGGTAGSARSRGTRCPEIW